MDIDDDDEDEVVDIPKKVVSDKTMFEHHIIVEIKDTHLLINQTLFRPLMNLK